MLFTFKKRGIKIPEDLLFTGFTNFSAPELFSPSLTTILQPAFEMGKTAMNMLLRLIESKRPVKVFEKEILPVEVYKGIYRKESLIIT